MSERSKASGFPLGGSPGEYPQFQDPGGSRPAPYRGPILEGRRVDRDQRVDLKNTLYKGLLEASQLPRTAEEATIYTIEGFADFVNGVVLPFLSPNTSLIDLEIPTQYAARSYYKDERYDREILEELLALKEYKMSYATALAAMRRMGAFTLAEMHGLVPRTEVQERAAEILRQAFALPQKD